MYPYSDHQLNWEQNQAYRADDRMEKIIDIAREKYSKEFQEPTGRDIVEAIDEIDLQRMEDYFALSDEELGDKIRTYVAGYWWKYCVEEATAEYDAINAAQEAGEYD